MVEEMPNTHPTVKTYEEFCKHYEQESDIGKRRLFDVYQVAVKFLEARRKRERNRYAERKVEKLQERTISIQTEPEPAPKPEETALTTIVEEEVVPVKVKRNSFTIPRPDMAELMMRSPSPARAAYPQVISNTKTMREPKRAPPV
jgi:hypothetical protein